MARRLDVWLDRRCAGQLEQRDDGRLEFRYAESWLGDPERRPISLSLPLRTEPFGNQAVRAFFGGLLPDDDVRERLARHLGVSVHNEFALLENVGRECAGALAIVPEGEPLPESTDSAFELLDDARLASLLRELLQRPLLVGGELRLSLAGAQDKIAVYLDDDRIALPRGGLPTTHLLKIAIPGYPDTVPNERFCLGLASALGVVVPRSEARVVDDMPFLLIERYDRIRDAALVPQRLHQEDFCQAFGVPPHLKYQSEGGPGLSRLFALLAQHAQHPAVDRLALLRAVIFNFLIGNADAHGKNFSVLHRQRGVALAPCYDLVSTLVYPGLSRRMAMKIGSSREFDEVRRRHWEAMAKDSGLAPPQVLRMLGEVAESLPSAATVVLDGEPELARSPVVQKVVELARARAEATLRDLRG